ncbi:MAG: Pyrimidine-specific ribonucleoside hydrolase RihB [Herbaspirillum frisingense]|uniref:Pyrimidine-specific ribonucleoside hydrolase RihB n=1 Tax=Herbaspirillum frisingense TaxID=92645 RepID=A0A7V8FSS4_9BURK|nr:MAG: Pyrimidine-specific ribonucleoside hydrolase RihB [Herbaspirillum frisingense]
MHKIWLDTDPGFDDWLAMLMLSANLDVSWLGVSVVAGNAPLATTYDNALRIKKHYHLDVPVYAGCDAPLGGPMETAQAILGDAGMATTGETLPQVDIGALEAEQSARIKRNPLPHAVDALIEAVRANPGAITLMCIAPLTNIAVALQRALDIAPLIKEIILMGGSSDQGNHTAAAEFNIFADPEAADVVFRAGIPLRMFGLNLCRQLQVTGAEVQQVRALGTARAKWLAGYFDAYLRIRSPDGSVPMPMYDPAVAIWLKRPELFSFRPAHVDIELEGRFTRGMTVCEFRIPRRAQANAEIAMTVDGPRAMQCMMQELLGTLS